MISTKKKPTKNKSAVERISNALTAGEKLGIPKDTAMFTVIAMEMQVLENKVTELQKKVARLEK